MGCPSCLWLVRQDHRLHHPCRGRLQRIGVAMTEREALNLALDALKTLMIERGSIYDKAITAIKEALAQRTWVGLTFDERLELADDVDWPAGAYCEYAEKIEAKLKEKNEFC